MGTSDCSFGRAQELHVLAVDDSIVDRKVIERLLKISCCKVTAVESGRRALQFLGLDGDRSSVEFDELKVNLIMTGYELLKKIKGSPSMNPDQRKKAPVDIEFFTQYGEGSRYKPVSLALVLDVGCSNQ